MPDELGNLRSLRRALDEAETSSVELVGLCLARAEARQSDITEVSRVDAGMARKIDDLGRIVIPAETRRLLNIREGDHLAIEVEGDRIILRKREVTVAVGAHIFELDRGSVADWERQVSTEIGSKDPERFTDEIKRRLGM